MTTKRRIGTEGSATRAKLLDITESLMRDEGYAAVSTRRVAGLAELTPALVHYYFPSTDDLLLAVYHRAALHNRERLTNALESAKPLQAIWQMSVESMQTTLASEFMALANHRKVIGTEIAENIAYSRKKQTAVLSVALEAKPAFLSPDQASGLSFILAAVSRALVMERMLGVTAGHREASNLVVELLKSLEGAAKPTAVDTLPDSKRAPQSANTRTARSHTARQAAKKRSK